MYPDDLFKQVVKGYEKRTNLTKEEIARFEEFLIDVRVKWQEFSYAVADDIEDGGLPVLYVENEDLEEFKKWFKPFYEIIRKVDGLPFKPDTRVGFKLHKLVTVPIFFEVEDVEQRFDDMENWLRRYYSDLEFREEVLFNKVYYGTRIFNQWNRLRKLGTSLKLMFTFRTIHGEMYKYLVKNKLIK